MFGFQIVCRSALPVSESVKEKLMICFQIVCRSALPVSESVKEKLMFCFQIVGLSECSPCISL